MGQKRIDQLPDSGAIDGTELLAGYKDSNPAGQKTIKITASKVASLNDAAIAAASDAAQSAQDTADAAIPSTEKGQANGVATLDSSGKIPASQLTIIGTSFKGNWDATANTPTLADTCSMYGNNQFEGDGGDYAIYWNNLAGTVIKNLFINNLRVEQESKFASAIVGVRSADGFAVSLNGIYHQAATSGTVLLESESVGGDTRIDLQNCYNSGGSTAWKLRNIDNGGGTSWEIHKVELQGQPQTESQLISGIAPYSNIWDLTNGGSIPSPNRVNFTPRLPKS